LINEWSFIDQWSQEKCKGFVVTEENILVFDFKINYLFKNNATNRWGWVWQKPAWAVCACLFQETEY